MMKPLGDRVLIKVLEKPEKTKSGILLPESAKEKPQEGTVIAVGAGRVYDNGQRVAPEVKVGDVVMYAKYSGTTVIIENEEYLVVSERDIIGIM